MITKMLSGHYSPETAYVVEDYPYGFKLRCKIRFWLEVNNKGTRFCSQTTNPKVSYEVWNKPKMSTYMLVGAMYLNEENHVVWNGLSPYDASKAAAFLETYKEGMTADQCEYVRKLAKASAAYEAKKANGDIKWVVSTEQG